MDLNSLVNSKDIGAYLKEINYCFNSLEASWLIYECSYLSYEDKGNYWNEIIQTMPNCEIPKRFNCKGWKSLHSFLSEYINAMDEEISGFLDDKSNGKYVYMYSYLYKDDDTWSEDYEHIYPSLSNCLDAYKEDVAEVDEMYGETKTGVQRYRIKRQSLDDVNDVFEIEFLYNDKVECILRNTRRSQYFTDIIDYSFDGLWFDFPTPFKKGDIVWIPTIDMGFVLSSISTWGASECTRNNGDNTDMTAFGYCVGPNGVSYIDGGYNYMSLEYYKEPYKSEEQFLPVLSDYVKGKMEIDELLCKYREVL